MIQLYSSAFILLSLLYITDTSDTEWVCPNIATPSDIVCQCDLPTTLRCTGLQIPNQLDTVSHITAQLRNLPPQNAISLLDLSIQKTDEIPAFAFDEVRLKGLVISSGYIHSVSDNAFFGLESSLWTLGLPSNKLTAIPTKAIRRLINLERLDLSDNKIKVLTSGILENLSKLKSLNLKNNAIQKMYSGAFTGLSKLSNLVLDSNGINKTQLRNGLLKGPHNLESLSLRNNHLKGFLTSSTFPKLTSLKVLNLSGNNFTSIRRGALKNLPLLTDLNISNNKVGLEYCICAINWGNF